MKDRKPSLKAVTKAALEKAEDLGPKSDKKTFIAIREQLITCRHRIYLYVKKLNGAYINADMDLAKSEDDYEKFPNSPDAKKIHQFALDRRAEIYDTKEAYLSLKEKVSDMLYQIEMMWDKSVEYRLRTPTFAEQLAEDCGHYKKAKCFTIGGKEQ